MHNAPSCIRDAVRLSVLRARAPWVLTLGAPIPVFCPKGRLHTHARARGGLRGGLAAEANPPHSVRPCEWGDGEWCLTTRFAPSFLGAMGELVTLSHSVPTPYGRTCSHVRSYFTPYGRTSLATP